MQKWDKGRTTPRSTQHALIIFPLKLFFTHLRSSARLTSTSCCILNQSLFELALFCVSISHSFVLPNMVASPLQTVTFLLALTGIVNALPQQPQGDSSSTNQGRSSKFGALLGSSFGIPGANQNFDYVIIGGGSAGLLVASRLAEDPSKLVAVIEAGGFYEQDNGNHSQIAAYDIGSASLNVSTINPLIDWGFVTTPQAVRQIID